MEIIKRIVYLFHKRVRQELDTAELIELNVWAHRHPAFQQLLDEVSDERLLTAALRAFDQVYGGNRSASLARMRRRIAEGVEVSSKEKSEPTRSHRLRKWLPYAAAVLTVLTAATYFFFGAQTNQSPKIVNLGTEDIAPGGNRARLTLADGRTIDLNEAQDGIVISGGDIAYNDGSSIADISNDENRGEEISYLTLTTPKGGTYQLTLADGSKVWLNAASTLKYPSRFNGGERIVELEGEGYFEVAKDTKHPFRVRSAGQEVEVLGTEFNVSAYADEAETKTTLVHGQVRLHGAATGASVTLAPGEQGCIIDGVIDVKQVDTELFTAWKEGFFYFDRLPTRTALAQLARWYCLELIYEGRVTNVNVFAYITRDKPLSAVLRSLEKSGLKFKITQSGEQKRLIVLGEN